MEKTAEEKFIYDKLSYLNHTSTGKNPIIDFELSDLCELLKEFATLKSQYDNKELTDKIVELKRNNEAQAMRIGMYKGTDFEIERLQSMCDELAKALENSLPVTFQKILTKYKAMKEANNGNN